MQDDAYDRVPPGDANQSEQSPKREPSSEKLPVVDSLKIEHEHLSWIEAQLGKRKLNTPKPIPTITELVEGNRPNSRAKPSEHVADYNNLVNDVANRLDALLASFMLQPDATGWKSLALCLALRHERAFEFQGVFKSHQEIEQQSKRSAQNKNKNEYAIQTFLALKKANESRVKSGTERRKSEAQLRADTIQFLQHEAIILDQATGQEECDKIPNDDALKKAIARWRNEGQPFPSIQTAAKTATQGPAMDRMRALRIVHTAAAELEARTSKMLAVVPQLRARSADILRDVSELEAGAVPEMDVIVPELRARSAELLAAAAAAEAVPAPSIDVDPHKLRVRSAELLAAASKLEAGTVTRLNLIVPELRARSGELLKRASFLESRARSATYVKTIEAVSGNGAPGSLIQSLYSVSPDGTRSSLIQSGDNAHEFPI